MDPKSLYVDRRKDFSYPEKCCRLRVVDSFAVPL